MIGISGGTAGEATDRPARVFEGGAWRGMVLKVAPGIKGDWESGTVKVAEDTGRSSYFAVHAAKPRLLYSIASHVSSQ
jgi:hypothetical protein